MRFNIQSKLLLSHLSAVSKVVNSKNKLSILDNFLFNLEGDKLVILVAIRKLRLPPMCRCKTLKAQESLLQM